MRAPAALPAETVTLLAQAAEWRLLGLLFEYPTDAWRENVCALLPSLPHAELRAIAEAALQHASPGLHIALFGPAGSVPVREVKYQGGVQFGYLMSELSAYYDAFGYQPQADEAADHLAVQLGFVSYLKLKQAHALANSDAEPAQVTSDAASRFLREHIAVQAEPVLRGLEDCGPDFLVDGARRIVTYAGPAPRSGFPLGSPDLDDDEMSCDSPAAGEDLVQLRP